MRSQITLRPAPHHPAPHHNECGNNPGSNIAVVMDPFRNGPRLRSSPNAPVLLDSLHFVDHMFEGIASMEMNRAKESEAVLQGMRLVSRAFGSFTVSREQHHGELNYDHSDEHRRRPRSRSHSRTRHRDDHRRRSRYYIRSGSRSWNQRGNTRLRQDEHRRGRDDRHVDRHRHASTGSDKNDDCIRSRSRNGGRREGRGEYDHGYKSNNKQPPPPPRESEARKSSSSTPWYRGQEKKREQTEKKSQQARKRVTNAGLGKTRVLMLSSLF